MQRLSLLDMPVGPMIDHAKEEREESLLKINEQFSVLFSLLLTRSIVKNSFVQRSSTILIFDSRIGTGLKRFSRQTFRLNKKETKEFLREVTNGFVWHFRRYKTQRLDATPFFLLDSQCSDLHDIREELRQSNIFDDEPLNSTPCR